MTNCRTSSRKSAPIFTSKRQLRQVRLQAQARAPKRSRAVALTKAPVNAKATLSMRSSKSLTRTRKNNGNNLSAVVGGSAAADLNKKNKGVRTTYGNS